MPEAKTEVQKDLAAGKSCGQLCLNHARGAMNKPLPSMALARFLMRQSGIRRYSPPRPWHSPQRQFCGTNTQGAGRIDVPIAASILLVV